MTTTAPPRRTTRVNRTLMIGILLGGLIALLVVALVGAPLALLHRRDLPLELLYGQTAVSVVSRLAAGDLTNPAPNDVRALTIGRNAYTGSCSQCHGATGNGQGRLSQLTYPPGADLTSATTKNKSDGQLFWITKHGLSFTAMPGFADQYSDEVIWGIVNYIRALQAGQPQAIAVPTPTPEELAAADPFGSPVQRGAALFFAMGCVECHGARGQAPRPFALTGSDRIETFVRQGRMGMPRFSVEQLSDADLADIRAYVETFAPRRQGG